MNILLWFLQILLAVYNLTGGIYMANNYDKLASAWALSTLSGAAWMVLGVLQVLLALGLVIPKLTRVSAVCLAVISLLGIALYVKYAGFPGILWALVPAILAAFVAYVR